MLDNQLTLDVSPYSTLYDIVVPKTHFLRQLTELCDFSFIYDELEKNYRPDFGRRAYSPIMMFKYLLLKDIYQLSDVAVVERSYSDMAFKYFLGLAPEDPVIEPSSLTKFRKLRIKDERLLDLLITKSVQIALELGLIRSHILIVDSTHTKAHYNHKNPQEVLRERSKALRKTIYQYSEDIKTEFPSRPQEDTLVAELRYTQELISVLEKHDELTGIPAVSKGFRRKEDEFFYNKDAGLFVCPEGHMAIRKAKTGRKTGKCNSQENHYFKETVKHRYKIEAKNAELKNRHGLDEARASGLFTMELQAATTIFVVNMKRIMA